MIVLVYLAGIVIAWPFIGSVVYEQECKDFPGMQPDATDLLMSVILGLLGACFWPLIVPGVIVGRRILERHKEQEGKP